MMTVVDGSRSNEAHHQGIIGWLLLLADDNIIVILFAAIRTKARCRVAKIENQIHFCLCVSAGEIDKNGRN